MSTHRMAAARAVGREDAATGTVVSPHEQSTRAGLDLLDRGGNAVDAAVAAALVAGVVEPTETSLAGSGFLLVNDPQSGAWSADFGPRAPLAASATMYEIDHDAASSTVLGLAPVADAANVDGPRASGVPRTLLGLLTAHQRWGRLPRHQVCAPAVRAAYDGFPADMWFLTNTLSDLARLRRDDQARRVYLDEGGLPYGHTSWSFYGPSFGARPLVRQPLLGALLEEAARGPLSLLTEGAVARRLVETSHEAGGLLGPEDLRTAAPAIGPALTRRYRDTEVSVPPAPGGGITELQILMMWEALNPDPSTSHESGAQTRRLALALRRAFADRYHWLGDPDTVPVPMRGLLSRDYIASLARLVDAGEDVPGWRDGNPWTTYASRAVHDPWTHEPDRGARPVWHPAGAPPPSSGTTHISAADTEGRVVAVTHTAANHFGSGVVCPRTGLLFDSAMAWFNALPGAANSIAPGARPLANMGPALVTRQGRSVAAVGASGGRRIVSAVAQVIINLVDGGHSPVDALSLPRLDGSGPTVLVHEDRGGGPEALEDLGAVVVPTTGEPHQMDFARPSVAALAPDGRTSSAIHATNHAE
ncbi:gamma-glutamyltransferase [Streptomyces olivaceus]|uniref:gamma-glutamyltransferase n=1 Tax=Streptomyces olivaceus TaxID=47716 RepID=UPI0037167D60